MAREVLDDPVRAGQLFTRRLREADEDPGPAGRGAEAGGRQRPADLEGVRGVSAFVPALERDGADALVALGKAALHEGDGQLVLPLRGLESDLPQPSVDGFDGGIQRLVDRLVVGFPADVRAVDLL